MNLLRGCALLVIFALVQAPLAKADARMVAVSNCNGGMSLLVIPQDDGHPKQGGSSDCAKACHGMSERRSKAAGKRTEPMR